MSDIEKLIRQIVRDELAKAAPANDPTPDHVTVAEFARARSISESTVRQAIADKRLPCIRIGRAVRVPANATIGKRSRASNPTKRARLVLLGGGRALSCWSFAECLRPSPTTTTAPAFHRRGRLAPQAPRPDSLNDTVAKEEDVEQLGNHGSGISRASLCSSVGSTSESTTPHGYQSRKEAGWCVVDGCDRRATDTVRCDEHKAAKNQSNAAYQARRRRKSAAMCSRCCRRRRVKGRWGCAACLVDVGRFRVVDRDVDRDGKPRLVTAVDAHDGFTRTRLRGGKRGAPGIDEQDAFERKIVKDAIRRYLDACEMLSSPHGKALAQSDRDSARMAALGQLALASRAADDILDRNRYDEKREKERARQLASTAREFVRSGR